MNLVQERVVVALVVVLFCNQIDQFSKRALLCWRLYQQWQINPVVSRVSASQFVDDDVDSNAVGTLKFWQSL